MAVRIADTLGTMGAGGYPLVMAADAQLEDGTTVEAAITELKERPSGGITEIPVATTTTLGAIKVGAHLSIDADGTLNAEAGGSGSGSGIDIGDLDVDASDEETAEVFNGAGAFFETTVTEKVNAAIEVAITSTVDPHIATQVASQLVTAMDEFKTALDTEASSEEVEEVFG